jgi:hypothetical protein
MLYCFNPPSIMFAYRSFDTECSVQHPLRHEVMSGLLQPLQLIHMAHSSEYFEYTSSGPLLRHLSYFTNSSDNETAALTAETVMCQEEDIFIPITRVMFRNNAAKGMPEDYSAYRNTRHRHKNLLNEEPCSFSDRQAAA